MSDVPSPGAEVVLVPYHLKPRDVTALRYTGDNYAEVRSLLGDLVITTAEFAGSAPEAVAAISTGAPVHRSILFQGRGPIRRLPDLHASADTISQRLDPGMWLVHDSAMEVPYQAITLDAFEAFYSEGTIMGRLQ